MKTLQHLSFALALVLVAGCAKEREVEEFAKTKRAKWFDKTNLLGNPDEPSFWMYKATVVKDSTNGGWAFVGLQSQMKAGYFEVTENRLKLFNAVSPVRGGGVNSSAELLNEWEITHHDVKLQETDGKVTNKEIEDDEKSWKERRYLKVDFAKANINEAKEFPRFDTLSSCFEKASAHLDDDTLEVNSHNINFTVIVDYKLKATCMNDLRRWVRGDNTYTVHFKYSFVRLHDTGYKPMVYAQGEDDPLLDKYGYFNTFREVMDKTGRPVNQILVNRWDPRKTHVYYFVQNFPEEYKPMVRDVFDRTNKVMIKAKAPIRFEVRDNTGQQYGDLRYSFVNFVSELDTNAPLGYGPSDANPFTGEIVAATLNVWTGYLKYYLERVKGSSQRASTRYEDSSLFKIMAKTMDSPATTWRKGMADGGPARKAFENLLMRKTFGLPQWAPFTASSPDLDDKIFESRSGEELAHILASHSDKASIVEAMEKTNDHMENHVHHMVKEGGMHSPLNTVYPVEPAMADGAKALINGDSLKDILHTILYRVTIHEFGHNLNLRHNFYGSVDKKNFPAPRTVKLPDGKEIVHQAKSASVMDYLSLTDEAHLRSEWESYDEAALAYAYSTGKVDLGNNHLFCTDEHRPLNAMCGTWDNGSTPTEVLMSLIDMYEDRYWTSNFRDGRGYWDTRGYAGSKFQTMWDVKRFLMLWRTVFNEEDLLEELRKDRSLGKIERAELAKELEDHSKEAIRLAVAFYDAVLQQSNADRPYRDVMDERSGSMKRIGITWDKIFAMRFLMGDETFMYDPSSPMEYASFMTYADDPMFKETFEKLFENAATVRVDMEPWFLGYGQGLFAQNAMNRYNRADRSWIERIKLNVFSSDELKKYFGIKPNQDLDTEILTLKKSRHGEFFKGDQVGVTRIGNAYYMAAQVRSPYSFGMIQKIYQDLGNRGVARAKKNLKDLFSIYRSVQ